MSQSEAIEQEFVARSRVFELSAEGFTHRYQYIHRSSGADIEAGLGAFDCYISLAQSLFEGLDLTDSGNHVQVRGTRLLGGKPVL